MLCNIYAITCMYYITSCILRRHMHVITVAVTMMGYWGHHVYMYLSNYLLDVIRTKQLTKEALLGERIRS